MDPKPGFKTSEGIATASVIGGVLMFREHLPDVPDAMLFWGCIVLVGIYTMSRAITKLGAGMSEDPDVKALGEEIRRIKKQ